MKKLWTKLVKPKHAGFLALLCICAVLSSGCTTFVGPGPLIFGGDGRAPADEPPQVTSSAESYTAQDASNMIFDWPVDEARLTRGFFAQKQRRSRPHWGIDLANKKNTPILASAPGKVVYTGQGFHGYGKLIVIEHGTDWATLYSHLNKILVSEGQQISRGEEIGLMGRTGRATGNHLHFEIRHYRQPVNPLAFLPQGTAKPGLAGMPRGGMIRLSQQGSKEGSSASDE